MAAKDSAVDLEKPKPLRVAIIGAGIGGLVLTQLLQGDPKFSVSVYERGDRDEEASSLTGFRILVSKEMLAALRTQLPASVTELLEKGVGIQPPRGQHIALLDHKCRVKLGMTPKDFRDASCVSRWKLRTALLEGLDDIIHWKTEFESYESLGNDGVRIHFADGTTTQCDVLVGADGAGSKIRKQLVPSSKRDTLGITVLYFKVPLTRETELMMPFGSGCLVMGPRSSMVVSYYKDKAIPYGPYNLKSLDPEGSYLMCGLGCYTNEFIDQSKQPDEMTPEELKADWMTRTKHWNPLLRSLISMTIPESVYVAHVKTQHKMKHWKTQNVVLLGDAAHSMTPYLGKGATSAIADSLSLAKHLRQVASLDNNKLPAVLEDYTSSMLKDGFKMQKKSKVVHDVVFMGTNPFMGHCRNAFLGFIGLFAGNSDDRGTRTA
ncbi:hypothetical protein F4821DRAFT_148886 [Hypoxylon rubiginosum]|uniref:Uncharacterized protein n=1 Tax=Hypoxylon rubiginosum TaxID=110542 RepID=A0ACC0CYL2_9PEZI|nr:hypothetical protein F4821DRAFT_148886 [Hypoxylon rubiginosum]